MTIRRGDPTVSVSVETRHVQQMTAGQLMAFADDLRAQCAPPTALVFLDRDGGLGQQLRCRWTEPAPEPPSCSVDRGVLADPAGFSQLRKAAGFTQQAVAKRVGLSRTSIVNLEAGRQDVPLSKLQAYATAVGARLTITPLDPEGDPR